MCLCINKFEIRPSFGIRWSVMLLSNMTCLQNVFGKPIIIYHDSAFENT